jgi:hypothetical protein
MVGQARPQLPQLSGSERARHTGGAPHGSGSNLESHLLTLALDWTEGLDATTFESSPTIDCFRDGGTPTQSSTGVLYAGSTAGNLFAVIVDDPGLDTTAPWPKYQHDIRNTGNPGTSLRSCP